MTVLGGVRFLMSEVPLYFDSVGPLGAPDTTLFTHTTRLFFLRLEETQGQRLAFHSRSHGHLAASPQDPNSRTIPRVLSESYGGGRFLMG